MTSVESVILSSFLSAMELKSTCVICSTVRECPWIRRWLNYNVYHPRQLLQLSVFFRHDGSEIAEFSQSRYYYLAVFKPCHNALRQKCSNLPRGKTTRRPLGGLCHPKDPGFSHDCRALFLELCGTADRRMRRLGVERRARYCRAQRVLHDSMGNPCDAKVCPAECSV